MRKTAQIGLTALVLLLSAATVPACSKPAPLQVPPPPLSTGQTLRVFTFPEYFGPNTLPSFEALTGSKIVVDTYATNEEMLQRLAAGARYDVVFPSSYAVEWLINKGMLREMLRDRVSNLVHVPEEFRNPPFDPGLRHCIPYVWSLTGLGLHTAPSSPARDPDTLEALFTPRPQNGRIAMIDDMRATLGMALRFLGRPASSQDPADLERVRALLLSQLPRVTTYAEDTSRLLRDGKVDLALAWSGDVLGVTRDRPEIRFVVPHEGTLLYVEYACVLSQTERPELAFTFLNHLLTPAVAAAISNARMLAIPNTEAQRLLEPEARWMWGTLSSLRSQGRRYEMLRDVGPAQPLYEQTWKAIQEARRTAKPDRSFRGAPSRAPSLGKAE